jgi:hypothetical protein
MLLSRRTIAPPISQAAAAACCIALAFPRAHFSFFDREIFRVSLKAAEDIWWRNRQRYRPDHFQLILAKKVCFLTSVAVCKNGSTKLKWYSAPL